MEVFGKGKYIKSIRGLERMKNKEDELNEVGIDSCQTHPERIQITEKILYFLHPLRSTKEGFVVRIFILILICINLL
jgi:hypothetical protein